ncbi:tyrosine-type recombinase/integrase [Psychrobacter sp. PP-21]|uniref:tyrosine-type recombinase/integrase n=1 Tax=Psychrobacter sp. PP-21 TaxID=2957503 RepID=UPI0029B8BE4B|nr:tyrosine-type recombinase/integrase [Psychrobacter sp. PP-21]MDX2374425.1 tyrosine-type recombinase/integrase [Psychrobacter sp. PP-21]
MDNISAHKLRQLNRDGAKKSIKRAAKVLIADYVNQNPMQSPCELQHHYEAINERLEKEFDTAQNFQLARRGFLEFVRDYNKAHQLYLNEPVVPILATRERLTTNYDWFVNGRAVADSSATMIDIWQRKRRFSINDLVEGLIYCSIMYGGVNDIDILRALYDWLFSERRAYQISLPATDGKNKAEQLAVIPLSVPDYNYGCALDSSDDLQRFIDYVPDDMSLCFLYALKDKDLSKTKIKPFNTIINDISKTLKLTNKDIERPQHSMLIKHANYHWRQMEGSLIDGALSIVKQGDLKTTGLPTDKLSRYNQEVINPNPEPLTWSELFDASYQAVDKSQNKRNAIAYPSFSKNLIKEVQDTLKLTRSAATSTITTLKTDASQPNAQRLLSWALSLLDDHSIRLNTISKYIGCIGRDWLLLTMDENIGQWEGDDFEDIYEQIIQSKIKDGRKTSILCKSSEFEDDTSSDIDDDKNATGQPISYLDRLKDSQKFTYGRLKAFHDHQRTHFDAPYVYFPWGNNRQVVKAEMVSPHVYRAMKRYIQSSKLEVEQKQLCLIVLALVYRTGMRINKIIGIKVTEIADIGNLNGQMIEYPKIILKPNRYRRLKSSSAKRVIPIDSLLKADELKQFIAHYHHQYRLKRRYLFSQGSGDQPLPSVFFSNMMKIIWDRLLLTHDFTFHSLRHTALSQLTLVLSSSPLAQVMTDYDKKHGDNIIKAILGNNKEQGIWFGLASLAGHLTPDTTFEHYIHTAHLLAGWQMSQAKISMPITVFEMLTGIGYQTINRQDGMAYDASTKQVRLDKMRGYLINKVAGKRPLFIDNDTLNNEACQQAPQSKPEEVRQSIFIHPKIYDVIALLEELQTVNVDKRAGQLAEVALRHGIAISDARQVYDNAYQLFTDDRLILGAPTGHKNQAILVKMLERVYQLSIDTPDELKLFIDIFAVKQNFSTSSIHFGIKKSQLEMLHLFVTVGCQLIDASHWQIRAHSEQAVRDIKKGLGLDSAIRVGTRKNFHGYEVRVVQKKRRRSNKNLAMTNEYYSSSGVLKYLGYLLMILI